MKTKQISISEFKAHCTEEIRTLEKGGFAIELTRHGKRVALITPVSPETDSGMKSWLGSCRDTVKYGEKYQHDGPAWNEKDWEPNKKSCFHRINLQIY
ncbi:MAG: type II toxin-antitoxin system Phd/YefM family antitoxin [Akkermansiaceae bacterium]|nr:type II toxin-antitoxin system Phd/YefM family antitoxin [Akkermansiaceae bacterium]